MSKIFSNKKKIVLISVTGVIVIVALVLMLLWSSYRELRKEIIPLCEEYIEFLEVSFPEDMISKTVDQREEIASQILAEKREVYDQLFSKDVSDYVKGYESIEKIAQNAVDLKEIVVFAEYSMKEFIGLKKRGNQVEAVFKKHWVARTIEFNDDGSYGDPQENQWDTFYLLVFVYEDDGWKIIDVHWNPFSMEFGVA